ncbi:hypothetical protein Tco_0309588 [Tanacetum coccineum]
MQGQPLGYRAAEIRMRAAVASPPSLLPPTSPRTDVPEADMPPRKRACLTTFPSYPGYRSVDHRAQCILTLEAQVATLITQTTSLQTRLTSALGRIATLEARDPEPQDGPAEAGSSIVYFTKKMLPTRRTTRATPATTTAPTTTVTEAQLQALIDQGVAAALAERDASRSRDGDNSHGSGNSAEEGKCPPNENALTLTS